MTKTTDKRGQYMKDKPKSERTAIMRDVALQRWAKINKEKRHAHGLELARTRALYRANKKTIQSTTI